MLQIHVANHITTCICSTRRTLLKISSTLLSSFPGYEYEYINEYELYIIIYMMHCIYTSTLIEQLRY